MEILVFIIMVAALLLIMIPAVPVSAVEWAILMIFGALTAFEQITVPAAILATVLMVIGSSSQYWAPFLGLKGKQMSCLSIIGFFIGAIIGTAVIPIPFLGTIVGGVLAVMVIEFLNTQDWRASLIGGKAALKTYIIGMVMEFVFSVLIIITFVVSVTTV